MNIIRAQLADFPTGKIVAREAPDFTVLSEGGQLGIEVTTYNGSARADEEFFSKGVAIARERYVSSRAPPCVARFSCSPWPLRHGVTAQDFAGRLVRVVRKCLPELDSERQLDWRHFEFVDLHRMIPEAHLSRIDGLQKYEWFADAGYAEHPVSVVSELLETKESCFRRARSTHQEVWLVIVAEGQSNARMLDPGQLLDHEFKSSFDRIFLIDLWAPRLYELRSTATTEV